MKKGEKPHISAVKAEIEKSLLSREVQVLY